mgnify:CR=1 FL=1
MTMEVWAFCLLLALAVWTAGISGYLIFGPLTFRHLLDRGLTAGLGGSFVAPAFLRWLFLRRGSLYAAIGLSIASVAPICARPITPALPCAT